MPKSDPVLVRVDKARAVTSMETLGDNLSRLTREGELCEELPDGKVRCYACGHRCLILEGHDGICRVRFNRGGTLFVPWNYFGALQCDPIEKKPFFHALPGTLAMSFGMLGCDLHCGYCQNWFTSQALRDPLSTAPAIPMTAERFVELAIQKGADTVTSTYNEPLITSEWAVEVFKEARRHGLQTSYVSNGNGTEEVLDYIKPWVDFYKVDLKSFNDKNYRQLGGKLDNVLKTVAMLYQKGFWLEIVTLFIPGFNDSEEEMRQIAKFLADISPDIPWHCTAFHPDYKMTDRDYTTMRTIVRACEIGREAGLRYCYAGNLPGHVSDWENTRCPHCNELLVERSGFMVQGYWLTADGKCPKCATVISGRWDAVKTRAALGQFSSMDRRPHAVKPP
jgi:pyruvate formate lyase activating enzyme